MATATRPVPGNLPRGVPPLRAGEGHSFLLRRLHSLSGVVPIGAFLIEHFISNSEALHGPVAYAHTVQFLNSLPWVPVLEWGLIFLPLLYHSLYGFYIWYRGQSNVTDYPWVGNWMYAAQRWTGVIAFAYILQHTYVMRFTGVRLADHPGLAFAKVQHELSNPWMFAIYVIGITAASWHFSYGLWLFAAKWGITPGDKSRRRFGYVCSALAAALVVVGIASAIAFLNPKYKSGANDLTPAQSTESFLEQPAPATAPSASNWVAVRAA